MAVGVQTLKVIEFDAAADTWAGKVDIDFFCWTGCSGAASLLVSDTAGNVLWVASTSAAGETVQSRQFSCGLQATGIVVTTMGSGKLYLHLR